MMLGPRMWFVREVSGGQMEWEDGILQKSWEGRLCFA